MTRPRSTRATLGLLVLAAGLLFGSHVRAEEEAAKSDESTEELTKKTQNPVADLISVPFQSNFNFGAGPRHALLYVLNVQPVDVQGAFDYWSERVRARLAEFRAGRGPT